MAKAKIPTGVTFFGILSILGGAIYIISWFIGVLKHYSLVLPKEQLLQLVLSPKRIRALVVGFLLIVAGSGILRLRRWARALFICIMVYSLLWITKLLFSLFLWDPIVRNQKFWAYPNGMNWLTMVLTESALTIMVDIFIIYYLTRPRVSQQFYNGNSGDTILNVQDNKYDVLGGIIGGR